jgi:hypothetical protein
MRVWIGGLSIGSHEEMWNDDQIKSRKFRKIASYILHVTQCNTSMISHLTSIYTHMLKRAPSFLSQFANPKTKGKKISSSNFLLKKTKLLTSLPYFENNSLIPQLVLYKRTTSCLTFNLELLSYFSKKAHSPLSNFPILQISLHSALHKLLHNTSLTSFRRNDCMSC